MGQPDEVERAPEQPIQIDLSSIIEPHSREVESHRERMRGSIALLLLCLLMTEIVFSLLAICWLAPADRVKTVMDWLTVVVSPTVALLGAATGFYFGTKSHE